MSRDAEALAEALGSRYSLVREIARGGMATVYLAEDHSRQSRVAVKLMDRRLASALGTARFRREIEVVRSMAHPLIVPLYDAGSADGLLYYVMPYVEGETIHDRLQRTGRLPVGEALQIARDVATALAYAHRRGVLHRDIKPENVLLEPGRALVADFGLARVIGAADSQKLTETGALIGTAFYLSPEQLREEPDLDARADVYSLGCVLYEMVTGEPPYVAPSLQDLVTRILRAPIPSARRLNPQVSPALDRMLARTLAKARAERLGSMEDFGAALSASLND
jgi:serine/threonine-protein kinase